VHPLHSLLPFTLLISIASPTQINNHPTMAPRKVLTLLLAATLCICSNPTSATAAILSSPDYPQLVAAINSSTNVQLSFSGTVQFPSPITINKLVEIDASGRNVDFRPANASRLFDITTNGHLILRGITLRNAATTNSLPGSSGYGGAIVVTNGYLTLLKCSLINNWARGGPSELKVVPNAAFYTANVINAGSGCGGAIAAFSSHLRLVDCLLEGNGAQGLDGKYLPRNILTTAAAAYPGYSSGGAIYAVDSDVLVDRCVFRSNSSQAGILDFGDSRTEGGGLGGAIKATSVEATDSSFLSNSARTSGGAISAENLVAHGCSFTQNSTTDGTGGRGRSEGWLTPSMPVFLEFYNRVCFGRGEQRRRNFLHANTSGVGLCFPQQSCGRWAVVV
jgi:predicted outer membrane repeat protein